MNLTILDHHNDPDSQIIHRDNVKIIFAHDQETFYQNVGEFINKEYDLVLIDQNHDSFITGIIHLLQRGKKAKFRCSSDALKKSYIEELKNEGIENILSINSRRIYGSDLDEFESIILINPHETGLSNISCCQILYSSLSDKNEFSRDLSGIGITSDYTLDEGYSIIIEILKSYNDIFPDLMQRASELSLNKYNIMDSEFGKLSQMFWAPCVLEQEKGVEELVHAIISNPAFSYRELLSAHKTQSICYLCEKWEQFKKILEKEKKTFVKNKTEEGKFIIYEPEYKSENFIREFSNIIKNENIDKIVIIKTEVEEGKIKYSVRRGEIEVDLGNILKELGFGGGNPFAAGCTVEKEDNFEEKFVEKVKGIIE